jgi:Flp pilus assembly protein TadD
MIRQTAAAAIVLTALCTVAAADERATVARALTTELYTAQAAGILANADPNDPTVLLERARVLLYDGDFDGAAALLARAEVAREGDGATLAALADGCARATAAAVVWHDDVSGVSIRFQDEDDQVLAPLLSHVVLVAREALARDLRVELPRPLRIEVVRDLFTLSAMTGLPESAAHTTGTVAVAKWGRITLLSPRAVPEGYPWADTLAHEMTHLAETRASADRAPLWLQEGVAKREETAWREPRTLDDFPNADVIAAVGFDRGLGRPIDDLGPSIAMLPSPEHALVAFAEVTSFVRFWVRETGEQALPELLVQLRTAPREGALDAAMKAVTGAVLADHGARWLGYLRTVKRDLPADAPLGGDHPRVREARRAVELAGMLAARGHHGAAVTTLEPATRIAPFDPLPRHRLAISLYAIGRSAEADDLVSRITDVHSEYGPWMALHARLLDERGETLESRRAWDVAAQLDPYDPDVACQRKLPPELPDDEERAGLCRAARAMDRE